MFLFFNKLLILIVRTSLNVITVNGYGMQVVLYVANPAQRIYKWDAIKVKS